MMIRRSFVHHWCNISTPAWYGHIWNLEMESGIRNSRKTEIKWKRYNTGLLVPTVSKLRNEERLCQVDLPSLFYRRLRVDLIETYKHSTYTAFTRLIVEPCLHWHWKVMEWLLVGTAWSYERENIARLWEPMYFVFVLFIFATLCLQKGLFLLHLSTVSRDVLMKNMLICVTVRI